MRILQLRLEDQAFSLWSLCLHIVLPKETLFAFATAQLVRCRCACFVLVSRATFLGEKQVSYNVKDHHNVMELTVVTAEVVIVVTVIAGRIIIIVLRKIDAIRR